MPSAPASLRVDAVVGTTVSLSWSAVSGATEYLVLVGSTSGNSNELFTNTSQTTYTYGGVKPGVHYARVQAKNACGTSGSSNQVDYTVAG
jgi:chitodextrinase